jgi:hypothetical protein
MPVLVLLSGHDYLAALLIVLYWPYVLFFLICYNDFKHTYGRSFRKRLNLSQLVL